MVIKEKTHFHFGEGRRGELAEACGWLFVDSIPLLYEKRRVARQLQIETWLDLSQLAKELGIEKLDEAKNEGHYAANYIV
ncbi:MAG: hypothetical protein ACUVTB_01015 [Candidatus Bathycorpusculaceae bacterium]